MCVCVWCVCVYMYIKTSLDCYKNVMLKFTITEPFIYKERIQNLTSHFKN